ncbi:hypothetical protein B9Z19DRAFT_1091186 [Tuber borchii]|uniref:Uncharacterized protein n=1 Tax=Tuber borchii TaxID=42251 RepID=A0A2T6ZHY4_TUBBO|nr:hypothetical protein B9Z19DRAFT_1091186 [Tuber borchii]
MQFTSLISAFVFAATALAAPAPADPAPGAPAPVVDSSTKTQTGATTWEFHPFLDASCQTPTGNTLGGSQTPGSQCINVAERYGDKVYSAASTQGCKVYVFLNGNTDCSGAPEPAASNTCSPYSTPISSIRVEC